MRFRLIVILLLGGVCAGCGTTKWTDTSRTATEQLLISGSMDRAVSRLDLRALAGKKVFLDETPIKSLTDNAYLASALKQHILASGAILKEKRDEADYVIEVRAGAVGTDRHELLFGVPALTIPTTPLVPSIPSQIPEVPLVKRTDQRGVASISLFVYNRQTGRPLYQSGSIAEESRAKAVWVFGAGPFQRGTIYRGTKFAGDHLSIPLIDLGKEAEGKQAAVSVADEAFFVEPKEKDAAGKSGVAQDGKGPAAKEGTAAAGQNAAGAPAAGSATVVPAGHTASPGSPSGAAPSPAASPAKPAAPSTSAGSPGPALAPPATGAASAPAAAGQSAPTAAPAGSSSEPSRSAPASSPPGPRLDSTSTAPFFPPSRYTDPSSLSWPLLLAPLDQSPEDVAGKSGWPLWR